MIRAARGFTLIEMLLSLSVIGLLAGGSLPVLYSFQLRNDQRLTAEQTVAALRRAGTYARGMKNDSPWSVRISASEITLYKGSAYDTRDTAYDEITDMPASLTPSGLSDITFAKLTGVPSATGTITLTSTTNEATTITLNAKGLVSY